MKCYNPRLAFRNLNGGKIVFTGLSWSQFIHKPDGFYIPQLSNRFSARADLASPLCIPCGKCDACHLTRAKETATRCVHEFQSKGSRGIFLTLTYDDDHLPPGGSFCEKDIVDFVKRLRFTIGSTISTLGCAEYGSRTDRAHFHLLIFGWEPTDSEHIRNSNSTHSGQNYKIFKSSLLTKLWKLGIHEFGSITQESCAYVARYTLKKQKEKKQQRKTPPKSVCRSLRPALGKTFFERFVRSIYSVDSVIMRSNDGSISRRPVPRYYDRLFEKADPVSFTNIQNARKEAQNEIDQFEMSKSRLKTKKILHQEKIKKLKGSL